MSNMFRNSEFTGDLSKWHVRNVEDMSCMFRGSKFNGDISKWDVRGCLDMSEMFRGTKYSHNLDEWYVYQVEDMSWMFYGVDYKHRLLGWNLNLGYIRKNMDLFELGISSGGTLVDLVLKSFKGELSTGKYEKITKKVMYNNGKKLISYYGDGKKGEKFTGKQEVKYYKDEKNLDFVREFVEYLNR